MFFTAHYCTGGQIEKTPVHDYIFYQDKLLHYHIRYEKFSSNHLLPIFQEYKMACYIAFQPMNNKFWINA